MSADKFDHELSSLYQQRKQQLQAPEFGVENVTKLVKPQRSPWHVLALLLTGGVASFGIMAVITHFAKPPVHGSSEQYKQHSVRVIEVTEVNTEQLALPSVTPPLPPKPASLPVKHPVSHSVSPENIDYNQPELSVNKTLNNSVNIPAINQPSVDILPIHRVMPEYPKSALYARKSGTVKLQYRISAEGKVVDIVGVNKQGSRVLERSAKQALAQWRYPLASASDKLMEIEFEFDLVQ